MDQMSAPYNSVNSVLRKAYLPCVERVTDKISKLLWKYYIGSVFNTDFTAKSVLRIVNNDIYLKE